MKLKRPLNEADQSLISSSLIFLQSQLLPICFREVEPHLFPVFVYYCSNLEWTFLCWSRTRVSYRKNDCPYVFIIYYIIWIVKREAALAKEQTMRLERWLTAIEWPIQSRLSTTDTQTTKMDSESCVYTSVCACAHTCCHNNTQQKEITNFKVGDWGYLRRAGEWKRRGKSCDSIIILNVLTF